MESQPPKQDPDNSSLGELDLYLAGEGRHEQLYRALGAHPITGGGVRFAVWAPNVRRASVVGEFNNWDGRAHPLQNRGGTGIWDGYVPDARVGQLYRFEFENALGELRLKSDPLSFACELRPSVASRVVDLTDYDWNDARWIQSRNQRTGDRPMSIYEVHLGSWMRHTGDNRWYSYRDLASRLVSYVRDMGFTHVELMPVMEHPFDPSWGYQVTGYFAATSRYGPPQDFMYLIDAFHQAGIGVILDWVPAHFPKDDFALAKFDGTALYEHADPRQGLHPDWGTLIFNYGRNEVRNFLIASALFWLDVYHIDGLRVDAVASMLYLDYGREEGDWVPNDHGGRENLEAVQFIQELNSVVHRSFPEAVMIAEESTAWPGVTAPTEHHGLEFDLKWNMGFMHDILNYFSKDPIYRKHNQEKLTFGLMYAFNERFLLPFSHDEVVHGKSSMLGKMPGDRWQKFANLRSLLAYQFAHPGKKLLFMGTELGMWQEWCEDRELDWDLLQHPQHAGLQHLVKTLAHLYRSEPCLWERDHAPEGFRWVDFSDQDHNVVSWERIDASGEMVLCVFNLSPVPRESYKVGAAHSGGYRVLLNTDNHDFGGSGIGQDQYQTVAEPWHGREQCLALTLPPISALYLKPE